jgi:hypothetical protein
MSVKGKLARGFTRATGYEIRRRRPPAPVVKKAPAAPAAPPRNPLAEPPLREHTKDSLAELLDQRRAAGDRLVTSPTFILSSVRSGSTLMRVMLDSHSRIYSPHELHLRNIRVGLTSTYVEGAMTELGLDTRELKYLLWDRLLHRELTRRGKDILVNKTPSDAFIWRALLDCWPDVKFIFLLRHPGAVVDSWNAARTYWTREEATADVLKYVTAVEQARTEHGGLTVRYEDITADPEKEMRRICDFLGIEFEAGMLAYGAAEHGRFKPGLGDWSRRIKTGTVLPAKPLPADDAVPEALRPISAAWGYLTAPPTAAPGVTDSVTA